ncbi:MAG: hypothetical protein AB8G77_26090 [Rhodothermales bacterium]
MVFIEAFSQVLVAGIQKDNSALSGPGYGMHDWDKKVHLFDGRPFWFFLGAQKEQTRQVSLKTVFVLFARPKSTQKGARQINAHFYPRHTNPYPGTLDPAITRNIPASVPG